MSDNPKASGPLWVATSNGIMVHPSLRHSRRDALAVFEHTNGAEKVRLLPGHGRWVPAELVAAIEVAAHEFDKVTPFVNDGVAAAWAQFVDVIRAAREGAL